MDMSRAADMGPSSWSPPWRLKESSAWAVVATSTDRGVGLHVDVQDIAVTRISTWIVAWLSAYAAKSPNLVDHDEITFFYILGTSSLGVPDGMVQQDTGVLEVGFGTDPSGPPNGKEIPL